MLKKIIIGILAVTVVGAAGTALAYNVVNSDPTGGENLISPLASDQDNSNLALTQQAGISNQGSGSAGGAASTGQSWQGAGNILAIDDSGFQFRLENGEQIYIELGPADYWRNQGVELQVGAAVSVSGTDNDGMIHAMTVALADGQILRLRTEDGQPLWSGGASVEQGQSAGQADGEHTPDPQAQVDEWITMEGSLLAFQGGYMTMSTTDGEIISFQTGQPRFFSSQGVTFQVGDEVSVVGYYADGQFMAGDITQIATGLRVFMRDPNGRPLWAGGAGGNGNGNGNQGAGSQY